MRSPEGVELSLPVATPAPRIAAYAIDFLFVASVAFGLIVLVLLGTPAAEWMAERVKRWTEGGASGNQQDALAAIAPLLVIVLLVFTFGEFLYFGLWEGLTRGLTPGKYLLRLRVVGLGGEPLEIKAALLRNLLRMVDVLPSSYAIGLVTMLVSERGQRLGDHAAGTLVIRTDRVERPVEPALPPDLEPLALSREQIARLGARELALVRGALRRFEAAGGGGRYELLEQVAQALATRLDLPEQELRDPLRLLQRALVTAQRIHRR
jgi:uncharacterized RDD family membrane protein YckC